MSALLDERHGPRSIPSVPRSSRTGGAQGAAGLAIFVFAVFASAFLIFLVQPMVGKRILPWFGGAPAVWTLCLAFYQSTLFLGYAYAHLLVRFAPPPGQLAVHAVVVCAALAALPVLPGDRWRPTGASSPNADILAMLGVNVALPFLVLAATGPLVQVWFARSSPERSPYPLYAVSNAGSLLALLAYPLFFEPRLGLSDTGDLWSLAFAVTAAAVLACAALAWRAAPGSRDPRLAEESEGGERPGRARVALWLLLPACAVVLLMGVTNKLCLDVASVPFLWILPLAAYLLTLILCFASERPARRFPYLALGLVTLVAITGQPLWLPWVEQPVRAFFGSALAQIVGFCLLLFSVCMMLHAELYRLRPPPRSLTAFYLCVAGGGALGGLFVGILAPVLFDGYYELELGLALAWLLVPISAAHDPSRRSTAGAARWRPALVSALAVALIAYVSAPAESSSEGLQYRGRTFFGVLRVRDRGTEQQPQRHLASGNTLHGVQFLVPGGGRRPSSYFGHATAIGLVMAARATEQTTRIGVIGLGAGTLAAYGREGDLVRFYEIDPAVVRIARDAGYFDFLSESPAEIEIVVGDARLSLARERAQGIPQDFDILVLDAFSSDAIPVHLLTREAFRLYLDALAPDGLLAVHVTNRYLDLMSQVARQGMEAGLAAQQVQTAVTPLYQSLHARWVLLSRDPDRLRELAAFMSRHLEAMGVPAASLDVKRPTPSQLRELPAWTDDYSDVFGLMRSPLSSAGGGR